jgi:uncharacterized membrane protein YfcA
MRNLNLTLAFLLEIIAFLGFSMTGLLLPADTLFQIISVLFLFALLIVFWGRFMSPRAPKKVSLATYYSIKFIIYGIAAFTIFHLYGQFESILFFTVSFLNDSLLFNYNKSQS